MTRDEVQLREQLEGDMANAEGPVWKDWHEQYLNRFKEICEEDARLIANKQPPTNIGIEW